MSGHPRSSSLEDEDVAVGEAVIFHRLLVVGERGTIVLKCEGINNKAKNKVLGN